jgi:hypothetical protein
MMMSPYIMSLTLLHLEALGNGCAQFISPSLSLHFSPIHHKYDIKIVHQRIQTTRSHASHCHQCNYCNVDFCIIPQCHTLH